MKIIIPGGSGHVGTLLAREFQHAGHEVVVLSRNPTQAAWRVVPWDAATLGSWVSELEGADVVINLAGRSVNCRYTQQNRQQILDSRVSSTRIVGQAIAAAKRPPHTWLQASTATIYAHRYDAPNDDLNGIIGGTEPHVPDTWRFSINVALAWEQALNEAQTPHTRKVALRAAMVMSPDRGGIFDTLLGLVRFGLGGQASNGRQYISWIHEQDFVRALQWLIDTPSLDGAISIAAPEPLPNATFMRILRETCGMPFGLPAARWMLEIGALVMGSETELLLKSRRVVPGRLTESGFQFTLPTWQAACQELYLRWKEGA